MTGIALIVTGHRAHTDRWHDLPGTSAALADVLHGHGLATQTTGFVSRALADVGSEVELLALNLARGDLFAADDDEAEGRRGLHDYVRSGRPFLAVHSTSIAFPDWPELEELLGGRWIAGTSMHPPIGPAEILIDRTRHPITEGVSDFTVQDERYTRLRIAPTSTPLTWHEHDGERFPLSWATEQAGGRVVYDALGHLPSSYEHPARRALLAHSVDWLMAKS
jgi:type 1 glutamine amidotransferase